MTAEDNAQKGLTVSIYEEKRGTESRYIDARITKSGDIIIECQDIGEIPEIYMGDRDYEFWAGVSAENKDRVLLALLQKLYSGDSLAVTEFENLMNSNEIPVSRGSYA